LDKYDVYGDASVLWHEAGHHVEYSHDLEQLAADYRATRTTSTIPQLPRDLTGNNNYDQFEKALPSTLKIPYTAKVYSFGATEVISMGLEKFSDWGTMRQFMLEDPEFFRFMVGILRGIKLNRL
jgi:hypothetical protein